MHKLKTTLLALLALSATAAATATAAIPDMPELLQVKENSEIISKSGGAKLTPLKGTTIECTTSTGTGKIVTRLTGTLSIDFKGCKENALKTECLGEGESKELLKVNTNWRLVWDTKPEEGKNLGAGIVVKLEKQIHMVCPVVKLLVLVKGEVLGLLKPTNQLVKVLELVLDQTAGENLEKVFFELEGGVFVEKKLTEVLLSLLSSEKEFITAGEEVAASSVEASGQEVLLDA